MALRLKALDESYDINASETPEQDSGSAYFDPDIYEGNEVSVVTGLAWTSVGGDILYIETGVSRSKDICKLPATWAR